MGLPSISSAQPWHAGERILQRKQGTVHSSDEMGPHIYHKTIPVSYRDMVGPQPHFMANFFDPETNRTWASLVFGQPGFADCNTSNGTRIDVAAALDPRDGAVVDGLLRPGALVGAVAIDFMTRRRNRFNGVVDKVGENGHFSIKITQAFGNCPKYITQRRVKRMGINLEFADAPGVLEASEVGPEEAAIIRAADNMYLGTGTAEHGADMNIRGGSPGFVRVLKDGRICWPDYTGNGFYMSLGNVQLQKSASLVFVDWDNTGRGIQIAGDLRTVELADVKDAELSEVLLQEPQALRLVVMSVRKVRSIPKYSPHVYERVELSPYNPRPAGQGAEYQAVLQWVREESKEIKTFEFQLAPLPRPGSIKLLPGQHVRLALPDLQKAGEAAVPERTWTVTSSPQWFADHARFQISVKMKPGGLASTWLHQMSPKEMKEARLDFLGFAGEFGPQLCEGGAVRTASTLPRHLVFLTAGVGITPAVAAITALAESAPRPESLTVFHSCRELAEVAFLDLLASAGEALEALGVRFRVVLSLTGPVAAAEQRRLEVALARSSVSHMKVKAGRLATAVLVEHLPQAPEASVEAFLCGPAGFETAARELWAAAGLPSAAVRSESFAY
mmetsp:Transcript_6467/g.14894  ORF Transcript_6467/g.14894 Transcript_6467/m.14894 type:complete len:616 (-) Transcript_6467:287-2134(-)